VISQDSLRDHRATSPRRSSAACTLSHRASVP